MDLQKLFVALEKAGVTTIGQARSALVSVGVPPSGLFINHAELDKAVAAIKPAPAPATPAKDSAAPPDVAAQAAALAVQALVPHLKHMIDGAVDQIHNAIGEHMVTLVRPSAAPAAEQPPATT